MKVYAAFLRGINVGGKNRLGMAELKTTLESAGLKNVETYIQSGNIVFKSDEEEETLKERIEKEIKTSFGLSVFAVVRTAEEMAGLVQSRPFSDDEIRKAEARNQEGESLYVCLFNSALDQNAIKRLEPLKNGDDYGIEGRNAFLLLTRSIRKSKLAEAVQKLQPAATVRNWKTIGIVQKIADAKTERE